MSRAAVLLALVSLGCASETAGARIRFARLANPILLGPVTCVGGRPSGSGQRLEPFHYVAFHGAGSYSVEDDDVKTTYATQIWTTEAGAEEAGGEATRGDDSLEIRITELTPYNWASLGGARQQVQLSGDIVRVETR